MKRNKRFVRDPWYCELVLSLPCCALCGAKGEASEGHHVQGRDWKKTTKSYEEPIHNDFRMVKVCGPVTDPKSCHAKMHCDKKAMGTGMVKDTLEQTSQDVKQRMIEGGFIG